jgi:hypothetical protein
MTNRAWPLASILAVSLLLPFSAGCAVTADLSRNVVNPPTLMVASPLPRTLYLVMTPEDVADAFPIRNSPHSVISFRAFFGETLRRTMRPYFANVAIVTERPSQAEPSYIADVRVDGVDAHDLPVGNLVYTELRIQWAFAIRASEASEYAFTFAGNGVSERAYQSLGEGFEQMTLSAVSGLTQRWTENDVFTALRGTPAQ